MSQTMKQMQELLAADAAKSFANHTAEITNLGQGVKILRWSEPGTVLYHMEFMIRLNTLIVLGDCGPAIYMWSAPISFKGLASYGLDYFASKIKASPYGQFGEQWFEERARQRLEEWVEQGKNEASLEPGELEDCSDHERRREIVFGASDGMVDDAITSIGDRESWSDWLDHNGPDAFGSDWYEWGGIGIDVNVGTRYHVLGIRAAMKWLEENA